MKLRLLAASLAAVGMMAGSSLADDVAIGAEYFDLYAVGDVITNMAAKATAASYTGNDGADDYDLIGQWSSGPNDLTAIAGEPGGIYLALDTEGDVVTNAFLDSETINGVLDTPANYSDENATATGEISLWANISFVPSDEIEDSLADGTGVDNGDLKFALYAYEHEVTESVDDGEGNFTDVTSLVTNLVVYHSFYKDVGAEDPELVYTNEVIDTAINFDEPQDVYITMKRIPGSSETFFKVTVENEITSPLACTDAGLAGAIAYPSEGGVWFRTVNADGGEAVSSINFSGTGSVAGLAATYATVPAGSTYSVDLTGCENVVVSNATAGAIIADISLALDLEAGVQLDFYPAVGSITNVNGQAYVGAAPYSYTVTTDASQVVTVLAGEEPVPAPTIITVTQTIGGHGGSISNGNFQAVSGVATPITITADQGYVVAQIVTNGFPVADALGEASVTFDAVFSDADGANNSIVATFAPDSAWFLDPFVRTKTLSLGGSENTFCASLSPEEGFFFVGHSPGASSQGADILAVQDFIDSLNPAFAPLASANAASTSSSQALRGGAASAELRLGIVGTLTANANWVIPFDGSAPYQVTHSIGAALDAMDFSANSAYLYAGAYTSGYRTKVYKLSFANGLAQGDTLTVEATYDVQAAGVDRVRAICVETIGGNEYVYVTGGDDDFDAVVVIDTATGTVTKLGDGLGTAQPASIDVAGVADGNPRLYLSFADKTQKVFGLTADGLALVSAEPIITISGLLGTASCPNVFTLDGETNAVACATASGARAYVLEKKPANLIVRGTFDDGETVDDRSVAFGAAASETFNAPAGTTITAVTVNGVAAQVAEGATSYTFEDAALSNYVYVAMTAAAPTYTVDWTGSQKVSVTNLTDEVSLDEVTSGDFTNGVQIAFYPTEGSITNILVAGEPQPVVSPFVLTVASDTNIVVLAGEAAQAEKPAWAADTGDGSATDKYWAWAEQHAAGQNLYAEGADFSEQYLLNVDANVTPTLHIDSVEITDEGTKIVVSAAAGNTAIDLEEINGVLDVYVGNALGSLTKKAIPAANLDFDASGKAEVIIPAQDGKFVKAGVDYSAPAASITEISE